MVPALQSLLAWESARAEMAADDATIKMGLGWQLLEALETLMWADCEVRPDGLLGALCRTSAPLARRADHIWVELSGT